MSWQIKSKKLSDYTHKYAVAQSGCWEWLGHLNNGGYGTTVFGSRIDGSRRTMLAHRVFYMLANDNYAEGLKVLHKCDNPRCVNPEHLWQGTQKDNMQDCARKGRIKAPHGEDNPNSKLRKNDVIEIRRRLETGESQKYIALDYGVNQTLISHIKVGRIWT